MGGTVVDKNKIKRLVDSMSQLTEGQIYWVDEIIQQFNRPYSFNKNPKSNLVTEEFLQNFGDTLRIYHCFSNLPFTKYTFEYAMDRVSKLSGYKSELATAGNPGHDITINNIKYSLKTQADKSLNRNKIHISKFMELGRGHWDSDVNDFIGLRDQFFHHLESYDRILSLRALDKASPSDIEGSWMYELVEIPKKLLMESRNGIVSMTESSTPPKSGFCKVYNGKELKFQLYFDGGGERKLQIQHINKKYCTVHATWSFSVHCL